MVSFQGSNEIFEQKKTDFISDVESYYKKNNPENIDPTTIAVDDSRTMDFLSIGLPIISDSIYLQSPKDILIKSLKDQSLGNKRPSHRCDVWFENPAHVFYTLRVDENFNSIAHYWTFSFDQASFLTNLVSLIVPGVFGQSHIDAITSYYISNNIRSLMGSEQIVIKLRWFNKTHKIDRVYMRTPSPTQTYIETEST